MALNKKQAKAIAKAQQIQKKRLANIKKINKKAQAFNKAKKEAQSYGSSGFVEMSKSSSGNVTFKAKNFVKLEGESARVSGISFNKAQQIKQQQSQNQSSQVSSENIQSSSSSVAPSRSKVQSIAPEKSSSLLPSASMSPNINSRQRFFAEKSRNISLAFGRGVNKVKNPVFQERAKEVGQATGFGQISLMALETTAEVSLIKTGKFNPLTDNKLSKRLKLFADQQDKKSKSVQSRNDIGSIKKTALVSLNLGKKYAGEISATLVETPTLFLGITKGYQAGTKITSSLLTKVSNKLTPKLAQKVAVQRGISGVSQVAPLTPFTASEVSKQPTISGKIGAGLAVLSPLILFKGVEKGASLGRRATYSLTREFVPKEKVFSSQVLDKGQTFPTVKSINEAVGKFSKSNQVAHAAPRPLKSKVVSAGEHALKGMEDPGLFVTPKGEASPYFLRTSRSGIPTEIGFGLLPKINKPTLVQVQVAGVKRQPGSILKTPGFAATGKYLESQAGTGFAFITKRSEASFRKLPTGRGGSTSELEAVIPVGTQLKKVKGGRKQYTVYEGEAVRIQEFSITGKKISKQQFSRQSKSINRKYKSFESLIGSRKTKLPITPYSSYKSSSKKGSSSNQSNISHIIGRSSSGKSNKSSGGSSPIRDPLRRVPSGSSITRITRRGGSSSITSSITGGGSGRGGGSSRNGYRSYGSSTPPPPRIPLFIPRKRLRKKKKSKNTLDRVLKYKPSLVAVEGKIKGKRKKNLSGLEIRPISY